MSDAITAQEIKDIRGMYGLSQKSFAQLLGIGPASMVRYEQGAVPSKANANLIRAARHPEFMLECLERDGNAIPIRQCEQARKCVYAVISLDDGIEQAEAANVSRPVQAPAANHMSKMDEVYHYTIQQEVLNEQAASLSCDLMNYLVENNIDVNDQTNPVAILLIQLLALKRSLIDETSDNDAVLEGMRMHFEYISEFVGKLNRAEEVA